MTRLQAIKHVRAGHTLKKVFYPEDSGVTSTLEVWVFYTDICDFSRPRRPDHDRIGPLHLRFWEAAQPHWLHISPKQLLGFIRRNFQR